MLQGYFRMNKMLILFFVAVSGCYVRGSEGQDHVSKWIFMRSTGSISRKFKDAGLEHINNRTGFAHRFGGKRCDEHALRIVVSDIAHKHFVEKDENRSIDKAQEQRKKLEKLVFSDCIEKN